MPDNDKTKQVQALLRPAQLLILIAAILAGILVAQFLTPTVFRASPSDLDRNGYLLDVLASPNHHPEYVVLGNSIAMQGIDTRLLSKDIPGHPLGYNLSSTGQGLTEANMFFTALPDSVETVIHLFYVNQLQGVLVIDEQKLNAMQMFGYRMDQDLKNELIRIYGFNTDELLNQSSAQKAFKSRWALRQASDTLIRDLVRTDRDFDSLRTELYFPSPKSPRLSGKKLRKSYVDTFSKMNKPEFLIYYQGTEHLDSFIKQVKASGRNYIMVVAPLNPAGNEFIPADKLRKATEAITKITQKNDVLLINAIQLLDEKDFFDALHPSVDGAGILTRYIAEQINANAKRYDLKIGNGGEQ